MVTWPDLFQFVMMVIAIITVIVMIENSRKK